MQQHRKEDNHEELKQKINGRNINGNLILRACGLRFIRK